MILAVILIFTGGCIAGVGTIQPIAKSRAANLAQQKRATNAHSNTNRYQDLLASLEERDLAAPAEVEAES